MCPSSDLHRILPIRIRGVACPQSTQRFAHTHPSDVFVCCARRRRCRTHRRWRRRPNGRSGRTGHSPCRTFQQRRLQVVCCQRLRCLLAEPQTTFYGFRECFLTLLKRFRYRLIDDLMVNILRLDPLRFYCPRPLLQRCEPVVEGSSCLDFLALDGDRS